MEERWELLTCSRSDAPQGPAAQPPAPCRVGRGVRQGVTPAPSPSVSGLLPPHPGETWVKKTKVRSLQTLFLLLLPGSPKCRIHLRTQRFLQRLRTRGVSGSCEAGGISCSLMTLLPYLQTSNRETQQVRVWPYRLKSSMADGTDRYR